MTVSESDYVMMASAAYYKYDVNNKEYIDLGSSETGFGDGGWIALKDFEIVGYHVDLDHGYITNAATGFAARIFRDSNGNTVVSFRGTENSTDWGTNAGFTDLAGLTVDQAVDADNIMKYVQATYGLSNVTVTGHSLGGGLAAMMAVRYDVKATVFNPAPYGFVIDEAVQGALFDDGGIVDIVLATQRAEANIDIFQLGGEVLTSWAGGDIASYLQAFIANILPTDAYEDYSQFVEGAYPAHSINTISFDETGVWTSLLESLDLSSPISRHAVDLIGLMITRGLAYNQPERNFYDLMSALPNIANTLLNDDIGGPVNELGEQDFTVLFRALISSDPFYEMFYDELEKITKPGATSDLSESAKESLVAIAFQITRDLIDTNVADIDALAQEEIFGEDANGIFIDFSTIQGTSDADPLPVKEIEGLNDWMFSKLWSDVPIPNLDIFQRISDMSATLFSNDEEVVFNAFAIQTGVTEGVAVDASDVVVSAHNYGLFAVGGDVGGDNIKGTDYDDVIFGGTGVGDVLDGGAGNDLIIGSGINSSVFGGSGNDIIMNIGEGSIITTGEGADDVHLTNHTLITDASSEDRVYSFGIQHTGGLKWGFASEDPYAYSSTGFFKYGINVDGDLVIEDVWGFGHQNFIANYVGGPGVANPTAGIQVAQIEFTATRLMDIDLVPGSHVSWLGDALDLIWQTTFGTPRKKTTDPLVLDLDGDGLELTAETTVAPYFDLDSDGFGERTGWVRPDDGFLVQDINGNGKIDNISEMFGDQSQDGFAALGELDDNLDSVIDASDTGFAGLKVWQDLNQNGVTDAGELKTLGELDITSFSLTTAAPAAGEETNANNPILSVGSFTRGDGTTGDAYDVAFVRDNYNSIDLGDVTVSAEAAALPELRGHGVLSDLSVAMTQNAALLSLVETVSQTSMTGDIDVLKDAVRPILWAWADADVDDGKGIVFQYHTDGESNKTVADFAYFDEDAGHWKLNSGDDVLNLVGVPIGSPSLSDVLAMPVGGGNVWEQIDHRDMIFFEKYTGEALPVASALATDAARAAINDYVSLYDDLMAKIAVTFAVQGGLSSFIPDMDYDKSDETFSTLVTDKIGPVMNNIFAGAPGDATGAQDYLTNWFPVLKSFLEQFDRGADHLVITHSYLFSAVVTGYEQAGLPIAITEVANIFNIPGVIVADQAQTDGTSGEDIFYLGSGDQTVSGGNGYDAYVVGSDFGHDIIDDTDGSAADVLRFATYASTDILATRDGIDLILTIIATGDELRIKEQFIGKSPGLFGGNLNPDRGVREITFADGVVWGKYDIAKAVSHPDATDQTITGTNDIDYLDGGAGNDILKGGNDADLYVFKRGYGQDIIQEDTDNILLDAPDMVAFGENITKEDLIFSRNGNSDNLEIAIAGTDDTLTINNQFDATGTGIFGVQWFDRIETFSFRDGTSLSWEDVLKDLVIGTAQTEVIYGFYYQDQIDGKGGSDFLSGGDTGDAYLVRKGYGDTVIWENQQIILDNTADRLDLKDVTVDEVSFTRNGSSDDLIITYNDSPDTITIQDQFDATNSGVFGILRFDHIEYFEFANGVTLSDNDVRVKMLTEAKTDGDDIIHGFFAKDVLDGGVGNDYLAGADDGDTYIFDRGYGQDIIFDEMNSVLTNAKDKVSFGGGISPDDLLLSRNGNELIFTIVGTSESLTIQKQFHANTLGDRLWEVEEFHFTDDTVWTRSDIQQKLLVPTDGDDFLQGFFSSDILDGGAGNDRLEGGDQGDTYIFGEGYGNDVILDQMNSILANLPDIVSFKDNITPENLQITRSGENLIFTIINTNETLTVEKQFIGTVIANSFFEIEEYHFTDGTVWTRQDIQQSLLTATDGDDVLDGFATADVLDGGLGNDTLWGGTGNDTYIFDLGYGQDIIQDNNDIHTFGGTDKVVFGAGITPAQLVLSKSGDHLTISVAGTSDSLTIQYQFQNDIRRVESFEFSDGTVWSWQEVQVMILVGTDGDDVLDGFSGVADILDGGLGNDTLLGDSGSDTYIFDRGYGQDIIHDNDHIHTFGGTDKVLFGPNITPDQINASRSGENVVFSLEGTSDTLTVQNQFNSFKRVESFEFSDGTIWSWEDVQVQLTIGTDGDDVLEGFATADILEGGLGNDILHGEDGSDVYVFNRGDGQDRIEDNGSGTADRLVIHGYSPDEVQARQEISGSGLNDLRLTFEGTSDSIIVWNTLEGSAADEIEQIVFDDGTIWNRSDIINQIFSGTEFDDLVTGYDSDDNISGQAGDDILYGGAGDDTIYGGAGDDILSGDGGFDTLDGGLGNDTADYTYSTSADWTYDLVNGTAQIAGSNAEALISIENINAGGGDDILIGTDGGNILYGGSGDDTIYGGAGDDILSGDGGLDTLDGGLGNDTADYTYSTSADWTYDLVNGTAQIAGSNAEALISIENINAGGGDDILIGTDGDNILNGGDGDDTIYGGAGDDSLTGGSGDDILSDGIGVNSFYGGAGMDTLDLNGYQYDLNIDVVLATITYDQGQTGTIQSIENIISGDGNDSLVMGSGDNNITGGLGSDTLDGTDGNDSYYYSGGDGSDIIFDTGLASDVDKIVFGENITIADISITLDENNPNIWVISAGQAGDELRLLQVNGGTLGGVENFHFTDGTVVTSQDMVDFYGITQLATEGDDVLVGSPISDRIDGLGGNDIIEGGLGNDTLIGGLGDDVLRDSDGVNSFDGGDGTDTVDFDGYQNALIVDMNLGTITDGGVEIATLQSIENITLGDGNDTAYGSSADNILVGGAGDDILAGGTGDDTLDGGEGTDNLDGGDGNDDLIGGLGDDIFDGQNGDDAYHFNLGDGTDYISDTGLALDVDKVVFGTQITQSDIAVTLDENDPDVWVIAVGPNGDKLRLLQINGGTLGGMENFHFTDGTVMTSQDMIDLFLATQQPTEGDDVLMGSGAADSIDGLGGHDTINGNGGDDTLLGGDGNDILAGGTGDDYLEGGWHPDDYVYNPGDGNDTIYEYSSSTYSNRETGNRLILGAGITTSNIVVARNSSDWDDVTLSFTSASGSIFLNEQFRGSQYGVEEIVFDDGTIWSMADLAAVGIAQFETSGDDTIFGYKGSDIIDGGAGNDTLYGWEGNDILIGGAGDDYLAGSWHPDDYIYNLGDGNDTIYEYSSSTYSNRETGNRLILGAGITTSNIVVARNSSDWDDVTLSFTSASGSIFLNEQFRGSQYGVEEIIFDDGTVWNMSAITAVALAQESSGGDDYLLGHKGSDVIDGGAGNDSLYGWDGSDTLAGGTGDDYLEGGWHPDDYIYNLGDGNDTIYEYSSSTYSNRETGNRLILGAGITTSNIIVTRDTVDTDDVTLTFSGLSGSIFLNEQFRGSKYGVEEIVFDDGTIWNMTDLAAAADGTLSPVVFDLGNDGIDLIEISDSSVYFDADNDGIREAVGWIGKDEAFLALDRNGNQVIDGGLEISFIGDFTGARTDLEGLVGFDSNEDGIFDVNDDRFADFLIWQDSNQNGISEARELKSLNEAGISSLNLSLTSTGETLENNPGNVLVNLAEYTRTDGAVATLGDVILRYDNDDVPSVFEPLTPEQIAGLTPAALSDYALDLATHIQTGMQNSVAGSWAGFGNRHNFSGRHAFGLPVMNTDLLASRIEESLSQRAYSQTTATVSDGEEGEIESLFGSSHTGFRGLHTLGLRSVADYLENPWDGSHEPEINSVSRPAVTSREVVDHVDMSDVDRLVQAMSTFDTNGDGVLDQKDFRATNDYGGSMTFTASSLM